MTIKQHDNSKGKLHTLVVCYVLHLYPH